MKYRATFAVEGTGICAQAFKPEQHLSKEDRSTVRMSTAKNRITFTIDAHDIVALKSGFTSVMRSLEILEKMSRIK